MNRATLALVLVALALGASACSSCGKKKEEPARDPHFDPTSDASARPAPSAPKSTITAAEARDMHTRLDHELCESAAKRVNTLNGRPETDPTAINLLSTCLKYGNNAWYRCVLEAPNPAALDACSRRWLVPADDLPR